MAMPECGSKKSSMKQQYSSYLPYVTVAAISAVATTMLVLCLVTPASFQQGCAQGTQIHDLVAHVDPKSLVVVNSQTMAVTPVYFINKLQYMMFPKNDQFVGAQMMKTKRPFDEPVLKAMIPFIKEGSTVLDVGGNIGAFSVWFAEAVGPKGFVVSFEPQSFVFQTFCANMAINGHSHVQPKNLALSFKEGMTHMSGKLPDGASRGKRFQAAADDVKARVNYGGRNLGEGGEAVRMVTLDSLDLKNISFIKIDAQGAEPLVVYGARETIKRELPVINHEVDPDFHLTKAMIRSMDIPPEVVNFDIIEFLTDLDYRLVQMAKEDLFWVPKGYEGPGGNWEDGVTSVKEYKRKAGRG